MSKKVFLIIIFFIFFAYTTCMSAENQKNVSLKFGIEIGKLNYLLPEEKEKLAQNGFVISIPKNTTYHPDDEAVSIYTRCKDSHFPVFVTSDIILHVSHLLFDWSLRFIEISSLRQDLLNLTDILLSKSMEYYDSIKDPRLKNAALKNVLFFNIAKLLLTDGNLSELPAEERKIIELELDNINKHEGFALSPLFGYKEDYSQYRPRGHYSRSPEFKKYFKAMMWYGRMNFELPIIRVTKREHFYLDKNVDLLPTQQAILICKALSETKIKGENALDVWKRLYEISSFFAGKSDDITVVEYLSIIIRLFGEDISFENINEINKLTEFVKEARQLRKPKILSSYVTDISSREIDWKILTHGMHFMGQRFTPDSFIIQNLVYDKVKQYLGEAPYPFTAVNANGLWIRGFPRGLDVMAVFGSNIAEQILVKEGDANFNKYHKNFSTLKEAYKKIDQKIWKQDLYHLRFDVLKSLIKNPSEGVPLFMQSEAWFKKQLNTSLGSWTELKHDTILYTKQPYSMAQMALAGKVGWSRYLPPEVVHGYVEPLPEVYEKVRLSIAALRSKLATHGFPYDRALENNFKQFEEILNVLKSIAQKELSGKMLNDDEYHLIEDIGQRLKNILRYAHYIDVTEEFRSEMDNKMPIIADVFTDVNSSMVLEEAVGKPLEIFVIAPVDGKNKVCLGVVYSYYEFKQPMSNRFTDEEWRSMLKEKKQPLINNWFKDIAVVH
ncbi:MAG: DUF3160 domain-containing protein [bacterium]